MYIHSTCVFDFYETSISQALTSIGSWREAVQSRLAPVVVEVRLSPRPDRHREEHPGNCT